MIHSNKTFFQVTRRLIFIILFIGMSKAVLAGDISHATHYSKATITTSNGFGKVYVSASNSAPKQNDWVEGTANTTQNCGGESNKDTHIYYFFSQDQEDNYLWAGWTVNNAFIEETQNDKMEGGNYYVMDASVTATSYSRNNPTPINVTARWWEPNVTNVVIDGVTANPRNQETKTISDPDSTSLPRKITFTTSEALSAANFTLTTTLEEDSYEPNTDGEWKNQYIIDATIPLSGVHGEETSNTFTLTSKYGGNDNTKSAATATITVVEDYTPLFGYSHDKYEFINGTETKTFNMEWLNKVALHSNTTWQVDLTGDREFVITDGNNSKAPTVTFTAPAEPAEQYEATLTISCSYKDKANQQINSNIRDANKNIVTENGNKITAKTIHLIATFEPKIVFSPASYDFGTIECGIEKNAEVSIFHNLEANPTLAISGHNAFTHVVGEYDNKSAKINLNIAPTLPVGEHTATLTAQGTKENGDPITKTMTITANVILQTPVLRGAPSNEQANLSWNKIPGATKYEIVWSGKIGEDTFTNQKITISDPNQTSYQHKDLTNNETYTYTLTAYCDDKDQRESNTVIVIPQYYPIFIAKNQTTYTDGSVAVAAQNTGLYTGPNSGEKKEINVSAAFAGEETKFEWLYLFVAQTSQGKYPCYIYRKDGQRYKYFDQTEMTTANKNRTYFELTTDIGSIYLTGYCGLATTGDNWTENGVLHITKGNKNSIDLYLDGLQLYAKQKSSTIYSCTQSGEVIDQFVGKSSSMEGSGAIFVFDGRNGSFNPTLHICNENILQSTKSMDLNIDAEGKVQTGIFTEEQIYFQMICKQESSVIHTMVDGDDDAFTITITDAWHDLDNAANTNEYRTNGSLKLLAAALEYPLINLGYNNSELHIQGGQINFNNQKDICISETYGRLYRHDKVNNDHQFSTYIYGVSEASISTNKTDNSHMTSHTPPTNANTTHSIHFEDGTIRATVSPLVCPDNTTIDGGSFICDVQTGNANQKDLIAGDNYDLLAYTNKNSNGKNVYRIPVDITESVGTIENGLAIFKTETDNKDGFQVLMDNIFPMANYKMTIDGVEHYAPLSSYYNPSTNYGHNSLAPEGTKVYLMLPQDGEIETYLGWSLCTPEVKRLPNVVDKNNPNNGGTIEIVRAGGSLDVEGTSKDPIPVGYNDGEGIKITNRLLYTEIDQVTKQVAEILDPENPEEPADTDLNDNVTLGHYVTNGENYTINEKVYMLLPVVAGEWRMIVAPFDVHNVYVIESYPEKMLKKVYGEERKGDYYIRGKEQIQKAKNAQARRLIDLLVYWMAFENLDTDFFGAVDGYGPFVKTWMDYEAGISEQNSSEVTVEGDYTPTIEQLYHYTGTAGTYPEGMKWYDANYYLYKSVDGSWELNSESNIVETDWVEVIEQSTPRTEGAPNVIMQKGGFYSMQFPASYTSTDWDYWDGKYILLEGYGPQTIDGSSTINTLIGQNITAPTSGVQLYGNGSFAKSGTLTHEHLYHTAKNGNGVLDLVRKTDAKEFGPIEGFAIGNLDVTTQSINDEGQTIQTQKIAKAIKMETGEVMYEVKTEIIDNGDPGLGSGVPTIMNGMTLIVEPTEQGLTITPIKEQHVMLFDADGKMIFSKHLSAEENVTLPTGVYVVRGEYEQVKAIKK